VWGGSNELFPGGEGANQALATRRAEAENIFAGTVGLDSLAAIALDSLRGCALILGRLALPIDLALLPEVDLLFANASEVSTMWSDPIGIARRLREGLGVMRGAAEASAFLADNSRLDLPAFIVDALDTTGRLWRSECL
jgi:sugar/nucleoside kinase (ribokinase family)